MPELIVPPTLAAVLTAFTACFQARSYRTFQWLVLGWVQCQGRRTLTTVALASGALAQRHISVFHRFFSRASWSLDALGHAVFALARAWVPADQPLVIVGDDTLARKGGKSIALASMHHDPLLSSARKPFSSFGHVWVVLALWVPLPFGSGRGFALPVLFRRYVGAERGGETNAAGRTPTKPGRRHRAARAAHAEHPRPTKLELLREEIALLATWAGARRVYVVVDSAYAGRAVLEHRPANVHVISRLRLDAALYAPPSPRRPGQKGRPRRRGERLPSLTQVLAGRRRWRQLPLVLYGRAVTPRVLTLTALWYGALREHQVRIVVVRDPSGRRRDEACFCTDLERDAAFILQTYARRWTLEVTFHDAEQHLGFGQAQSQALAAVQRTAPFAGLAYSLVLLWAAAHVQQGGTLTWVHYSWYRAKAAVAFPDLLVALRQELWRARLSTAPSAPRRLQKSAPTPHHVLPLVAA
jgi:DDE superfamily endonuclease